MTYSLEYLMTCLLYDANTGNLIWKERPSAHFKTQSYCDRWNKKYPGKIAGTKMRGHGRDMAVRLQMRHGGFYAHHVILMMHGIEIPTGKVVDHVDGNPFNNRLENLRVVEQWQNACNKGIVPSNVSGIPGVCWYDRKGKWIAYINYDHKRIHLGYHSTKEEAALARSAAVSKYHGQYAYVR